MAKMNGKKTKSARMYGKARSPWAVCRAQEKKTGKRWTKKKFERCVIKVKGK